MLLVKATHVWPLVYLIEISFCICVVLGKYPVRELPGPPHPVTATGNVEEFVIPRHLGSRKQCEYILLVSLVLGQSVEYLMKKSR